MGVRKLDQFMAKAIMSAALAVMTFSEEAHADFYQHVVRFECNPTKKEVVISLLTPYEDKALGKNDILFERLAETKEGLLRRLSSRNVVVIRALSNPQSRRNDNLVVMVNSKQVATLTYDQISTHVISISEGKGGSIRVLSKKEATKSNFVGN